MKSVYPMPSQPAGRGTKESETMKPNVGGIDRILRILVGLALIALAATGAIGAWGYIGVVPLLTGVLRTCPAYKLLELDTCPLHKR
jgi:hypothetical protein